METEIPAMLESRPDIYGERFTYHSSRMRMQSVTQEELERMDAQSEDCAALLADARCDALAYACLIGIMAQGPGYHEESEQTLHEVTVEEDGPAPVITSAGALIRAANALDAERVAIITPYTEDLTNTVIDYFEGEGVSVTDSIHLECPDNLEVAELNQRELLDHLQKLDHADADAVVLSSCVQMPSLESLQAAEDAIGKPVFSASAATTWDVCRQLNLSTRIQGCGRLLAGDLPGEVSQEELAPTVRD